MYTASAALVSAIALATIAYLAIQPSSSSVPTPNELPQAFPIRSPNEWTLYGDINPATQTTNFQDFCSVIARASTGSLLNSSKESPILNHYLKKENCKTETQELVKVFERTGKSKTKLSKTNFHFKYKTVTKNCSLAKLLVLNNCQLEMRSIASEVKAASTSQLESLVAAAAVAKNAPLWNELMIFLNPQWNDLAALHSKSVQLAYCEALAPTPSYDNYGTIHNPSTSLGQKTDGLRFVKTMCDTPLKNSKLG